MPPLDGGFGPATGFYAVLTSAINAILDQGYVDASQIAMWVEHIRRAAIRDMISPAVLEKTLNDTMRAIYRRNVDRAGMLKYHPGVERFTLARVAPKLRSELDRRIMASANLIKLNRQEAIETTLRRFSGWATSIPPGGTDAASRRKVKEQIRKPIASLPFVERRVAIDQGMKLTSSLSEILATDGGALAGHWVSHFRQKNYDFRPEHKHLDIDGGLFVVPDNWALRQGLMKLDGARYITDIERPGEKPFCRCYYQWVYSLNRLPVSMLTEKGRAAVAVRLAA